LGKSQESPSRAFHREFCLALFHETTPAFQYFTDALKTEALCLAALQQDGKALGSVPEDQSA